MNDIFRGCLPALMTPCDSAQNPDFPALVAKATELVNVGMRGVVYCGSMGDWPLLTDVQRQEGVQRLCDAGIPVVVGTGAVNTASAVAHVEHAARAGAAGLMLIPRLLSRATSPAAQRNHFSALLAAAPQLPAVIYNSPYYGFETKSDLFFDLRQGHPNLVGFKEFGGAQSLSYAAEHITSSDPDLVLVVGVDTQVFHGYLHCGAEGTITGIGNVLPVPVLHLIRLCQLAKQGDSTARNHALCLSQALHVLSSFDEGPDLVLYYKYLLVLSGEAEYSNHWIATDCLSPSQKRFAESQFTLFNAWWSNWPGRGYLTEA